MSSNNFPSAGAGPAVALEEAPVSRAARATVAARAFREDETLRTLEAARVFVSAFYRDFTPAGTSVQWIEPLMFTPIIRVDHTGEASNENGVVVPPGHFSAVRTGRQYNVMPGHMETVLAPPGGVVVNVERLRGVGTDWGTFDVVDALNELCFPEDMIPASGPNWLDPRDPRHQNLFANIEAHLEGVKAGSSKDRLEYVAAEAALVAIKNTRTHLLAVFNELARQSSDAKAPIPFGPTESMWCVQMGMAIPEWAVEWDRTRKDLPKEPSAAERTLDKMLEYLQVQAEQSAAERADASVSPAIEARLSELAEQNQKARQKVASLEETIAKMKTDGAKNVEAPGQQQGGGRNRGGSQSS